MNTAPTVPSEPSPFSTAFSSSSKDSAQRDLQKFTMNLKYNGLGGPAVYTEFMDKWEIYTANYKPQVTDSFYVNAFAMTLTGEAHEWYRDTRNSHVTASWKVFQNAFEQRFGNKTAGRFGALRALRSMKYSKSMNPHEYASQWRRCYVNMGDNGWNDRAIVDVFAMSLPDHIAKSVLIRKPENFDQARQYFLEKTDTEYYGVVSNFDQDAMDVDIEALEIEAVGTRRPHPQRGWQRKGAPSSKASNDTRCFKCNRLGHISKNCRFRSKA